MNEYNIYGLYDPDKNELRYVGISKRSLRKRWLEHLRPSELTPNTHKNNWIKKLLSEDKKPYIAILKNANSLSEANEIEKDLIANFKRLGYNLTNTTSGGDGTLGVPIKKTQKIIISRNLGGHKIIDSNGIVHDTQVEAASYYNIKRASISANLLKRTSHAHGIVFEYILDENKIIVPCKPDLEKLKQRIIQNRKCHRKFIGIKDDLGNIYPDLKSAAKSIDCDNVCRIWDTLNGKSKSYKGRVFQYIYPDQSKTWFE